MSITKPFTETRVLTGAYYDNATDPKYQLAITNEQKWGTITAANTSKYSYNNIISATAVTLNTVYYPMINNLIVQNSDVNVLLFARNNDINNMLPVDGVRVYLCEIVDENNNLIHNYIPVRINNEGYLYDTITETLFNNAGTGSFILGPDKH
jgi:hypothetical protein